MNYFLVSLIFFTIFFIGMSIGYILKGKKLNGSCGGLGKLLGKDCDFCEKKDQCIELEKDQEQ